ncbi:MAG: glycosyltransferase [Muribaculaceae bacterium]|nr:glycosyltransferase [Muribaculaceae bacterium]
MNRNPLISIITITWNAADVLRPTMASVAAQTCDDYEHIIIDGASTDATLAVARELATPALRILSEPDRGLYDAMNKGLTMARGRYVLFLNAGDAFHAPDVLDDYARAARSGADIIYADTDIVDASRRRLGPRHLSAPERLTFGSFSKGMLVCHQAFMVRRELAPPYDTAWRFSADYDWTVKCIKASTPERNVNLHRVAIDYLADGTTDRNKRASLVERFRIMCRHYGSVRTSFNHLAFAGRALGRRLRKAAGSAPND